jgi:hypothetical protein
VEPGESIPVTWIVRSGLLVGAVVVLAIALAIGGRCVRGAPGGDPATARAVDRETQLAAALRDLEHAKSCSERRAQIAKLVELRDSRAVAPLKRARDRAGTADNNNACLRGDADRAVKQLSEPARP